GERALGESRLLPHPGLEVGVRTAHALGEPPRDVADLTMEVVVEPELEPSRTRHELDRAIVVRRAEPSRHDAEIGAEAVSQRILQLVRAVADDLDPCRLEPEPEHLVREKRSVAVRAVA